MPVSCDPHVTTAIQVALGAALIALVAWHVRRWRMRRPRNLAENATRAATAGTTAGVGAAFITGAFAFSCPELFAPCLAILFAIHAARRIAGDG